jgi:polyhydroxyalkanoate synthase
MMAGSALPLLSNGLPPSKRLSGLLPGAAGKRAEALERALAAAGPDAFPRFVAAVAQEAIHRHTRFLAGIKAYRHHPYDRDMPAPPVLWRAGTTRLLDYRDGPGGLPVLAIPSLVNRAYVLDLTPRRSLMRGLAARGLAPLLLDWDAPGDRERSFTLTDYVIRRLEPALERVAAEAGGPVALLGYCMGGLLALALAQRRPDLAGALVLLATPWDFAAALGGRPFSPAAALTLVEAAERRGEMPADWLDALFMATDPTLVPRKFTAFGGFAPAGARARDFVALEDWVNDGVPLTAPVARDCLLGWYGANDPARGNWRIDGRAVRPETLTLPTLAVVPWRDRVVPPDSALPLADAIPGATVRRAAGGHVGMLLTARAATDLYTPLAKWIGTALSRRAKADRT